MRFVAPRASYFFLLVQAKVTKKKDTLRRSPSFGTSLCLTTSLQPPVVQIIYRDDLSGSPVLLGKSGATGTRTKRNNVLRHPSASPAFSCDARLCLRGRWSKSAIRTKGLGSTQRAQVLDEARRDSGVVVVSTQE